MKDNVEMDRSTKATMDIEVGDYDWWPVEQVGSAKKMVEFSSMTGRAEADYIRISTPGGWWWITAEGDTLIVGVLNSIPCKAKVVDHLDPANGQDGIDEPAAAMQQ